MSAIDATSARFGSVAHPDAPRIAFKPHLALPWLLLPEGMPLQLLIDAAPTRVPNTRHWFQGVVGQRGNLMPLFDLAGWAALPDGDGTRPQIVAIGVGAQACAMLCATAPTLLSIDSEDTTSNQDGALSPFLGRSYNSALGRASEFDIGRWLKTAAQHISADSAA